MTHFDLRPRYVNVERVELPGDPAFARARNLPVSVGVILDISGRMERRIDTATRAVDPRLLIVGFNPCSSKNAT